MKKSASEPYMFSSAAWDVRSVMLNKKPVSLSSACEMTASTLREMVLPMAQDELQKKEFPPYTLVNSVKCVRFNPNLSPEDELDKLELYVMVRVELRSHSTCRTL
jgi:hypothetical protein